MRTFTAWLSGADFVFALIDARHHDWQLAIGGFISSIVLIVVFWPETAAHTPCLKL